MLSLTGPNDPPASEPEHLRLQELIAVPTVCFNRQQFLKHIFANTTSCRKANGDS